MGLEFVLNGTNIDSPLGWQDAQIKASFQSGVQPNLTVDSFTFGNDSITIIDNWILTNGYFRGCPLLIREDGYLVFDGYLDFQKKFIKIHYNKYLIAIQKNKGLNQLIDTVEGYTFSLLQSKTPLSVHSVPYLVEKKDNSLEIALLSISTLLILKETYESVVRLSKAIKELSVATANSPFSVGLFLGVALQTLIDIIYTVSMVLALKKLMTQLLQSLISPIRYHKSMNCQNALDAFTNTIGKNGFSTGISELSNLYYFPSKEIDAKSTGIPNSKDNGYLLSEFIDILKKAFNAKLAVDNVDTVHLRSENDVWFLRNSTYIMPSDTDLESTEYNIDELKGTRVISFKTDVNDEWTIDDFKGTAYDIHTSTVASSGVNLVKGLDETRINVCLATRKDKLNTLEKGLKSLASLVDGLINTLGGSSNLTSKVTTRLGMVKVSDNSWNEPKLLLLDSSLHLSSNHRTLWSAKSLYNNYHNHNSFVLNGNKRQRKLFKNIEIPFCLEDLKKVIDNSYFNINGKIGKFTNLKKGLGKGKATADFWIHEVYDTNLIETYIEP